MLEEIVLQDLPCVEGIIKSLLRTLPKIAIYIWKDLKFVKAAKKRRHPSLKIYTLEYGNCKYLRLTVPSTQAR